MFACGYYLHINYHSDWKVLECNKTVRRTKSIDTLADLEKIASEILTYFKDEYKKMAVQKKTIKSM